jgi:DNA (cytosine-5)-methyltransferase 1
MMMNELALFAGAGGGLLATTHLLGWRTVAAVEIDPYRREVLLRRQLDGVLDVFPIWDDCRTFDGEPWAGLVDVVTAGFPCQPFSVAGKRRGADDERNGWPDTIRIIREVRPRYAFLENVPGLLGSGYFGRVLGDLAEAGFDAEWCVLGADDVGAPHRRKRLWILAVTNVWDKPYQQQGKIWTGDERTEQGWPKFRARRCCDDLAHSTKERQRSGVSRRGEFLARTEQGGDALQRSQEMADADRRRREQCDAGERGLPKSDAQSQRVDWWNSEPQLGRVADGVAHRIHRLAAIGDGQVPAVVALAWHLLYGKSPRPHRTEGG